jgi:hypothetical protein
MNTTEERLAWLGLLRYLGAGDVAIEEAERAVEVSVKKPFPLVAVAGFPGVALLVAVRRRSDA